MQSVSRRAGKARAATIVPQTGAQLAPSWLASCTLKRVLSAIRAQLLRLDHALRAWAVTHRIEWLDRPLYLLSTAGVAGGIWMFLAVVLAILHRVLWRDV